MTPDKSELGKKAQYDSLYNADKLFPIPRKAKRDEIGISNDLPFFGYDIWNHYEVSWLNSKGKPIIALAKIMYNCDSKNIIESKSMKLYFNSFNNTKFESLKDVQSTIKKDLEERLHGSFVDIEIVPVNLWHDKNLHNSLDGTSIDGLDVECSVYHTETSYLTTNNEQVEETLCSDLLKSNCLVTNQPDWCSIQITYKGNKINREGLLRYLISFRNDNEFHEQCIEKIFMHIMAFCKPTELTIYGRSTRRGGLDINSYRSTIPTSPDQILNTRLCRQ